MWNWVERELYVKPGPLNPEKPRVQSLLSSYVTLSKLKAIYPQIGDNFWFCFHRLKWGNHTYIIVALNESNVMAYIKYMVSTIWNTVVLVIYWCVPNHSRIQVHKTTVSITLIILWIKNSGRHRQNRESLLHDAYGFRVGDLNSRDGCDNLTGTMPKSPWFWLFAQVFGGSLQGADWGWNIILYYFSLIHLVSGLAGQNTAKQARHPFFSMGPLPGARLDPSEHADFRVSRLCTTAGSFQTNIPRRQGTSCCLQPFLPQFRTQLSFNERRHLLMRRVAYTHRQEELFGVIFR